MLSEVLVPLDPSLGWVSEVRRPGLGEVDRRGRRFGVREYVVPDTLPTFLVVRGFSWADEAGE